MWQQYLLCCSCGIEVPIETAQAGGNVLCDCGLSLKVPTLLQIKKLPLADAPLADGRQVQSSVTVDASGVSSAKTSTGTQVNLAMFVIGLFLTIAAVSYCVYTVRFTSPEPQDVMKKQVVYHFAGKVAAQDSTPIPMPERYFFVITDEVIDYMNPIDTIRYWELVKDGPAMSMNFRENYETFKDYYHLRCAGTGILVLIALSLLISSFFLGRSPTVGTRQGTEWK
jgi:hypothetical protein